MPHFKHRAWHLLFDNFPVLKILALFQEYYELFGMEEKSRSRLRRNREWVRAKPFRVKKQRAWNVLFQGLTLEEIVFQINEIWIDPDYELVIVSDEIRRVVVGAK